jgi:hypothetical protein
MLRPHRRWLVPALLAGLALAGCIQLNQFVAPTPPGVMQEWRSLVDELRAFERRMGFRPTKNFAFLAEDLVSYPYCGRASNRRLPYSYQDGAIEWPEVKTEAECRDVGPDTDVYFGHVEAWGEIGTPVTQAMLGSTLDRFVYLVIHEDCHDQFDLPYGIEEPICDVLSHRAMAQFGSERFRWYALEHRSIKSYARIQSRHVGVTITHYERIAALYRRFERGEISHDSLLQVRARLLARAEQALDFPRGQLNNLGLANYMTYSRHYPLLARVIDASGADLAGTVEFFRLVDARKPSAEALMKQLGVSDRKDVRFLQAYEAAIIQVTLRLAAERGIATH